MAEHDGESWLGYGKLVLSELKRLDAEQKSLRLELERKMEDVADDNRADKEALRIRLDKTNNDVMALKIKAGMWGGIAGTTLTFFVKIISLFQLGK